jgi:hypothetical protein
MEVICCTETSIDFPETTRRYTPKDRNFHNRGCENLIPYITLTCFSLPIKCNNYIKCVISVTAYTGPGREPDHSPQSSVEVRNGGATSRLPQTF